MMLNTNWPLNQWYIWFALLCFVYVLFWVIVFLFFLLHREENKVDAFDQITSNAEDKTNQQQLI